MTAGRAKGGPYGGPLPSEVVAITTALRRIILACSLAPLLAVSLLGCPRTNGEDAIVVTVTDEGGGETTPARSEDQTLTLAQAEGEITWFTSIPEKEANAFARGFEARHAGLRVRLVRGGTFDLVDRIEGGISGGTPEADVLHVLDPAIFVALRQRGELMYYANPQAASIAAQYRDPGYWTAARIVTVGLACDQRRLHNGHAPRQWNDLRQSRWQGKLGLKDAQTAGSAYAQYYFLREKYGVNFWEQLAALKPRIYKTEEELLAALVAGEIHVAAGVMGYKIREYTVKHPGAVSAIWPTDGVPLIIGPVAILSRAPHPNAARLFLDYCLSREGQIALRDLLGAYSPRTDVEPPPGGPALASLKLLTSAAGWEEYLGKQGALRAEYSRLFHGESE